MPAFLLIESSSNVCSVAVARDEKILIHLHDDARDHAAMLAPMIRDAMKQASVSFSDLSCIGINGGPGSYTGLRIGLSTAKGLCYAKGLPLVMVDATLAYANGLLLTTTVDDDTLIVATVDNRRDELFYAVFDSKLNVLQAVELTTPRDASLQNWLQRKCVVTGSAHTKLQTVYSAHAALKYVTVLPTTVNLLNPVEKFFELKRFADVAYSEPYYYKDVYIAPKAER